MADKKSDPLWIEHAHLKKGALHKAVGVAMGKKIPKSSIAKAAHEKGKVGKEGRAAETLAKLPHK